MFVLIVTEEAEDNIEFYSNHPEQGLLRDIVFGKTASSLMKGDNEGLFYQLYDVNTGKRIGYGILDFLSINDDIMFFEKGKIL
jgi:hypothetical protein